MCASSVSWITLQHMCKAFQSRKTMVCCGMGDLLKSWYPRPTSVAWRSLRSHTPILHWNQPQTSHLVLITQSCQEPSSQSKPQPHGETTILTMRPHQVRCLCPRADEKRWEDGLLWSVGGQCEADLWELLMPRVTMCFSGGRSTVKSQDFSVPDEIRWKARMS